MEITSSKHQIHVTLKTNNIKEKTDSALPPYIPGLFLGK